MINRNICSTEKIKLSILAFAIAIMGVPFSGASLSLMYYYPVILFVIFLCFISILNDGIRFQSQHVAIAVLLLITIFHITTTIDNFDTSKSIGSIVLFFIMFFLLTSHKANLKELKFISNCFMFSGFIISVLLFIFKSEYEMGRYTYPVFDRLMEPNYLASYLSITFLFSIKKIILSKKIFPKILYILISFSILYAMLLTGSRAAFLSTVIASIFLLFYDIKYSCLKIFSIIILFLIVFFLLPQNLIDRFVINPYYDDSNRIRLALWENAISFIKEKPFLGYGVSSGQAITNFASAHNTFLSVALNFGIIGLISYCMILFKYIKLLFTRDMFLFAAIFISLMVTSMIITNYNTIPLWFTIIYITLVCDYKERNTGVKLWKEI